MNRLPVEIVSLIFQLSKASDVSSCRLVCRKFAIVGLQYLEVGKHFYFRLHSLNRLKYIANHPVLSQRISDLVFFVDVLPKFDTEGEWIEQARGTCHTRPQADDKLCLTWLQQYRFYQVVRMDSPDMPTAFIQSAQKDHEAIRKEQEVLLAHLEDDPHEIRHNFSKLLNLKSFSLQTFGQFHQELMRCLYTLRPMEQSWYCCNYTCSPTSFAKISSIIMAPVLDGQSKVMFPGLESLDISATDFADFTGFSPKVSTLNSSLRQVQSISLSSTALATRLPKSLYSSINHASACNDEENGPFLQRLFVNSPNLVSIVMRIESSPEMNTKTIFSNCNWDNLQRLELSGVEIETSTFEAFLSAHSKSLHTLLLHTARIRSASPQHRVTWVGFLRFIQQTMNLTEFELGGYFADADMNEFDVDRTCSSNTQGEAVPIHRIIRYLICGKACSMSRYPDESTQILLNWHTLSWTDVEIANI